MTEALATVVSEPAVPPAVALAAGGGSDDDLTKENLRAEAVAGVEKLRQMAHDELRQLIAQRVAMLQTELKDRGARREALEEAQLASKILVFRRNWARKLTTKVNLASTLVAAGFAGVIFYTMFPS